MTTDRLDPDKIEANLKTKRIGRKILVFNSTSSTNDIAAEYARNKGNDGLAVFAEEQTKGRGRAGARWHSGRADSILCSIVLADSKMNAELLSVTCAVGVAEAIGKVGNAQAKVKWPNDIMLDGRKVAGILLESRPSDTGHTEVAEKDDAKVTAQWRDLSVQLGHRITLSYDGREFTGNCIGIDPEKGLILQLETGGVRMFEAAQTSVQK